MSLGVTPRRIYTQIQATDTEDSRWENQGQGEHEGANQVDQFRQEDKIWTHS